HLSHVAQMFSEGNFNIPMFIHDTTPPGVPTMEKLHNEIHYHYRETAMGGDITIKTANPKALDAVHEFLRFQITEHQTGDPTEVRGQRQTRMNHALLKALVALLPVGAFLWCVRSVRSAKDCGHLATGAWGRLLRGGRFRSPL